MERPGGLEGKLNISFADTALCEAPVFGNTALHYIM